MSTGFWMAFLFGFVIGFPIGAIAMDIWHNRKRSVI